MKNPLFPVSITFLLGIIFAANTRLSVNMLFCGIVAGSVLIIFFIFLDRKKLSHGLMFFLIFFSGMSHFVFFNKIPGDHIDLTLKDRPGKVYLNGTIVSNPVFRRKFGYFPELGFLMKVETVRKKSEWVRFGGLILVNAYYKGDRFFAYGDKIIVQGKITQPRGDSHVPGYNYKKYLAAKKIHYLCKNNKRDMLKKISSPEGVYTNFRRWLYSLKNKAGRAMIIGLPPSHSGILAAMMLGERQYLDKQLKQLFVKTGTVHILAISGLHVGIIVYILWMFLRVIRVPVKPAYLLTVILIFFYAMLIGERASVWRAAIMASCFLTARAVDRRAQVLNILSFSLLILLVLNPNYIYDLGFILSFTCIASILFIAPFVDRILRIRDRDRPDKFRKKKASFRFYLCKSLSISISVWIGVFPLIAYFFRIVTPVTILANLIAVPGCFAILSLGMVTVVFSALLPPVAPFLYGIIVLTDNILLGSLELFTKIPFSFIELEYFPAVFVYLYYLILGAVAVNIFLNKLKTDS